MSDKDDHSCDLEESEQGNLPGSDDACFQEGAARSPFRLGHTMEIHDLPNEYGQIDENLKSWDALIAYLYVKYLKELGRL